jgi:hypothetical protein
VEEEVQEIPTITGISVASGPREGGTQVTLYGYWFKEGCAVYFGPHAATQVQRLGLNAVSCTTPAGDGPATVEVSVLNPDGRFGHLPGGFTYWWGEDWPFRSPITLSGSPAGSLTDFQVRITLPFTAGMQADFRDIRFTQWRSGGEPLLPYWIETLTPSQSAECWVRVPDIPAFPDTTTLYVYFGNDDVSSLSDFETVFTKDFEDAGLVGLWHMDEGGGFSTGDASGNGNTGLLKNMVAPQGWSAVDGGHWGTREDVGFISGSSLLFDGVDDFVNCGTGTSLIPVSGVTIEAWIRGDTPSHAGKEQVIASKWQVMGDFGAGSWSVYDPETAGVGTDLGGFWGAGFDGRYAYFVPFRDANPSQGPFVNVLRYDTTALFSDTTSWSTVDLGSLLSARGGYGGAVFDGRFLYFVPCADANGTHAEVARYDTTGVFKEGTSWALFDAGGGNVNAKTGYAGGVFDGRYIYFVPDQSSMAAHGEVLQYDVQGDFTDETSWTTYEPQSAAGFRGAIFDGRYIYFSPHHNGTNFHSQVLRYDTLGGFNAPGSWTSFDPGSRGGYAGGVFDGRYVYFAPSQDGSGIHGEILRYDTRLDFQVAWAWTTFDAGLSPVNALGGYAGALFDGRYIAFVPYGDGSTTHAEVLIFDTTGAFTQSSAWTTVDPGAGPLSAQGGYMGALSDGRFLYFVPSGNSATPHGEFLRFDTTGNGASYRLSYSRNGFSGAFSGAPMGAFGIFNTETGVFSVASSDRLGAGTWHHFVLTYDGAWVRLYIDGLLKDSRRAIGFTTSATAPVLFGRLFNGKAFFNGAMDEIRIYSRVLSPEEVLAHCERRKYANPEPQASSPGTPETR